MKTRDDFALTYVVNTFNKLPFLKQTLPRLLAVVGEDEEVVVIDGASNDGTVEYLRELEAAGQIDQLLSEPDQGEAHGWNKGLLRARGELIKPISDDDAFHYPGIQACRQHLLAHPEIDLVATEGVDAPWTGTPITEYHRDYRRYVEAHRPFSFCGLGLMFRRRSLAVTGLINPGFKRADHEFSLRVTHGPAHLAWYCGFTWVRIASPHSVTARWPEALAQEWHDLNQLYLKQKPPSIVQRVVTGLGRRVKALRPASAPEVSFRLPEEFEQALAWSVDWLEQANEGAAGKFLDRGSFAHSGEIAGVS